MTLGIIFGGMIGLMITAGIISHFVSKKHFNQRMAELFPDCPFKIKDGEYKTYFVLQDDYVGFSYWSGTKPNGIKGPIGINLDDYPNFRDGTDMLRLHTELQTLVDYLKKIGYAVKDENKYIRAVEDEVNQIDNFAYIKAKKEGRV